MAPAGRAAGAGAPLPLHLRGRLPAWGLVVAGCGSDRALGVRGGRAPALGGSTTGGRVRVLRRCPDPAGDSGRRPVGHRDASWCDLRLDVLDRVLRPPRRLPDLRPGLDPRLGSGIVDRSCVGWRCTRSARRAQRLHRPSSWQPGDRSAGGVAPGRRLERSRPRPCDLRTRRRSALPPRKSVASPCRASPTAREARARRRGLRVAPADGVRLLGVDDRSGEAAGREVQRARLRKGTACRISAPTA